jgi:glycerol kinase
MPQQDYVLAIDQGTTSTRAILFDVEGTPCATASRELPQHYPHPGWVKHDPEQIWRDTVSVVQAVLNEVTVGATRVAAIGIANQRETTILWIAEVGNRSPTQSSGRTVERLKYVPN